ncbi:MAG: AAA family ATPase [Acidimicrobiales bacterium]
MRRWRRDRQPKSESESQSDERFFEEDLQGAEPEPPSATEAPAEAASPSPSEPDGSVPAVEPIEATESETEAPAEAASSSPSEPDGSVPAVEPIEATESETAAGETPASVVNLLQEPPSAEVEVPSALDPAPEPEVSTTSSEPEREAASVAAPNPEPEVVIEPAARGPAHAKAAPAESFADRAQAAISRLGELPSANGIPKVRPLPRVVAIANQKGGVGKTTTTVNLGAALSELDYRVLVVDLDPQGNATSGLGIDTRNFEASMYDVIMRDAPIEDCIEPTSVQNLFVTPATIDLAGVEIELVSAFSRELKLKRAIDTVVDDFDFVLIDCPPSLGLLTINGLAAASEVLVPIQCEYYALEGLSQLLRNVQLVASNLNMGLEISAIVLTMFDARTRLAVDVADEVRSHFKEVVCRSIIPRTVRLSEAPSFGQPITVFDPSSRGAVAYRELAKEVSDGAPKRSG